MGYDGTSGEVTMPEFGSSEMRELAHAVETACRTHRAPG
jgi:hypothetical protein